MIGMIKLIKKYLALGIGWGCFIVVANAIRYDLINPEHSLDFFGNFTSNSLTTIAVIMGFISSAIVYEIEQLQIGLKLVIHFVVGIGTLLVVRFLFNLHSLEYSPITVSSVLINILILVTVWIVYYIRDKCEVQKINERLQEQSLQKKLDTE